MSRYSSWNDIKMKNWHLSICWIECSLCIDWDSVKTKTIQTVWKESILNQKKWCSMQEIGWLLQSQYWIDVNQRFGEKNRSFFKTNWHHEGISTSDFGKLEDINIDSRKISPVCVHDSKYEAGKGKGNKEPSSHSHILTLYVLLQMPSTCYLDKSYKLFCYRWL